MAWITNSPQPVRVSNWSVKGAAVTISWDTEINKVSGTVWVDKDDGMGFKALTDRSSNRPAVGGSDSVQTFIELGRKYVFELRDTNNKSILLFTLVVEAREKLGLPAGTLNAVAKRMPLYQGITNLRVSPGFDEVRIRFRTRQPTVPVIRVTDVNTQVLVGAAYLKFPSTTHEYTFPLTQGTDFAFHIAAYAVTGPPAEQSGLFRTGSRIATVFFDRVRMHRDGDPGLLGDGDFWFQMGVGDMDSAEVLGSFSFADDISGGESVSVDRSVPITRAPAGLWVQVYADEDDTIWTYFRGPEDELAFAQEGSVWSHHGRGARDSETIVVTKWFNDLTWASPVPEEFPFTLETGPKHINFSVDCRLVVHAVPGAVLQPMFTKSVKPIMAPKSMATVVAGDRIAVTDRTTHVLHLADDGGLYYAHADSRAPSWTRLAGDLRTAVTVIAAADELHLLTTGSAGEILYRVVSPEAVTPPSGHENWRSLGVAGVGLPAVAVTTAGIDLFAVNAEGAVFHTSLTGHGKREWTRIGEGVTGSLNAFTAQHDEIGLVGRALDADILWLAWNPHDARAQAPTWRSLGSAPQGELSAEVIDDVVVLAVLTDDEIVHAAPWRDYPEPPSKLEWQEVGTMNALISARYALGRPSHQKSSIG